MVCEFLMMEVEFGRWGGGGRVQWGHLCKTNHTKMLQYLVSTFYLLPSVLFISIVPYNKLGLSYAKLS